MNPVVLLAVVRRSEGLFAWISNDPGPEICVPLAAVPLALYPQRDVLLADWHSLRTARRIETVWPAFWRIFWSAMSEAQNHAPLAMPQQVAPAARPPATAAHPRAFRGTKFKPPKQPGVTNDWCAWLGDDRLLAAFFALHDFSALPAFGSDGQPLQGPPGDQFPAMPGLFRRNFLWHLRARPMQDLLAWLHLWRGLGTGQALAARLCALDADSHEWAALALGLPPARQIIFFEALLAEQTCALPFGVLSVAQLISLDVETEDDQRFDAYLKAVLSNLNRQVSAAYTLCGCTLANRVTESRTAEQLGQRLHAGIGCPIVPMTDIYRMGAAVGTERRFWELSAWETCGTLPGFDRVLRETDWEKLGVDVADQWLALFAGIMWDEYQEEKIQKRWSAFQSVFAEWHLGLIALSGQWQVKYMRMLRSYVSGWEDPDSLRRSVPYLLPLQRRLCHPPFSSAINGDCVLSRMAENLPAAGWRQLAATPDKTWLICEQACRRDNDATLIGRGLHSLTQCWPDFLMRSFSAAPKRLMRTARLLGCLAYERRRQFLAEAAHAVWFATKWNDIAPCEAARQLYRLCLETGVDSPVPRRLREHFEGRAELSDLQLERHCRVSMARLPTVLLAALENRIWTSIDTPFQLRARSNAASHAVRLLAGLDRGNRKGLRRFLLDYCQGRPDTHSDHPLNRAWFARHPRIDAQVWRSNPHAAGADNGNGIQLALETDPLQILMMGTYVGSCLGLGGLCDYSAVACLLDANKQIVYARDPSGRVLARQLLGIDEQDRLVCFAVYPLTADPALVRAFHAFDLSLARALGIEVYAKTEGAKDYDIAIILAQDWWDDGVWDDGQLA
jgi:hypothetical protein